jgi:hypothetical protein
MNILSIEKRHRSVLPAVFLLSLIFRLLFCSSCSICTAFAAASAADMHVTLKKNESLRQVSQRLLGDEDAWKLILRYNGIQDPDAVSAGTSLRVPVALYTELCRRLQQAETVISEANNQGAALLAEKEIAKAGRLRDYALALRKEARLQEAAEQAALAETTAMAALEKAKKAQTHSTEAWLASKAGRVQNRPPAASRWQETELQQKLKEREKIRTLAASRCIIEFSDQSEISLDEHALVVIGAMKKNIIRSSYSNDVSMIEGDITVHLASLSAQKKFRAGLPGITTEIRSRHFLTSRDEKNITRIANYDGEIDIKAQGAQVTVKKNQATKVVPGYRPTAPKELLPPPTVLTPQPEQKLYTPEFVFTWKPVAHAGQYRLEISRTSDFRELLLTENVGDQQFHWQVSGSGIYFFRIKTIDQDGCPGPYSEPAYFFVDLDDKLPFLVLHVPEKDITVTEKKLEVRGEAEQDAQLRINGQEVRADATGHFRSMLSLNQGNNIIKVEAVDAAGNSSTVERTVIVRKKGRLLRLDNAEQLISKTKEVAISGRLLPDVRLLINKKPVQAVGAFTHLLLLDEGEHAVALEATGPKGQRETIRLRVLVDLHPPEIHINDIERMTAASQITLNGTLSEEAAVTLNGKELTLAGRQLETSVPLVEGRNELVLLARDTAGNRAVWRKSILRDTQPPKVLDSKLTPAHTKGGEVVRLAARIEDTGVGTAQSGSFTLGVNGKSFKGILKSTGEKPYNFTGSVFVRPGIAGPVEVQEIIIQDMLGNTDNESDNKPDNKSDKEPEGGGS